nr:hypothetical protein [Tanacetum cinerariifolium]
MNTTQAQQKSLDDNVVTLADRLEFRKCNIRLHTNIKPKEATFQVVLEALGLTPFYQAFLITAVVLAIYMQEFWATVFVHKELGHSGYTIYITDNKTKAKVAKSDKKKQPAKMPKAKGLDVLSKDDDEDDFEDDVDNDDGSSDDHDDSDDERKEIEMRFLIQILTNVDQTEHKEEDVDERVHTPSEYKLNDEKILDEEIIDKEEEDEVTKELYDDVNVNLGNKDTEMTNADQEKVINLEKDRSVIKQVDQYAQALFFIPAIVNRYMDNKLGESINKAIQAHNFDCRKEAQAEKREYIELVDSTVRTVIKEEVNTQLPHILPQSSCEATATLFKFELTKILIDKMEKNKSFNVADYKRELYDALVKSYNTKKDIFESYCEVFSLKRSQDDKDKDQDPSTGSDRGMKRRKSSKDVESSRDSRSKENKYSSISKDVSKSQHKSSGKSTHAEEPSHIVEDSGMQQHQEFVTRDNDEQPADKEVTKADWFKKPERPPTPNHDWSKRQQVDFRPPRTWISQVSRTEEPPTSFDELNDTSFDFSAFVMNRLKIPNLTQEIMVGPAFNPLKGTCKSITELEYHFEESSKATTKRLDWHNPENKLYPFDLRKPLSLI